MNPNSRRAGVLGSLSGTVFLVGLFSAIFLGHGLFLPLFFLTLGATSFIGALSANNMHANMGGFQGLIFFAGLAFCAATGWWWPGIMIPIIACAILGTLHYPITSRFSNIQGRSYQQPYYQPPQQQPYYQPQPQQPYYQPPQQSYQEGYQPQQQAPTYQEGGQQHQYPQPSQGAYETPQAQYPPQEMPPQQR